MEVTSTDTHLLDGSQENDDFENNARSLAYTLSVSILLVLIILATIVGNVLVIVTILATMTLRTNVSYWLLLSLALSDLLVAVLVMPFGLKQQVGDNLTSGETLCDIWIWLDVTCCTASILNVACIAVDRYYSITQNTSYLANRKICNVAMIIIIWLISMLVSTPPFLGWRDRRDHDNPEECLISQDIAYTIFSTMSAFYIPFIVIVTFHYKIYKAAKITLRRKSKRQSRVQPYNPKKQQQRTLTSLKKGAGNTSSQPPIPVRGIELDAIALYNPKLRTQDSETTVPSAIERRTVLTLGFLISVFIICWLPFFVQATLLPFCTVCAENIPRDLSSFILWLGYCNSLCNPMAYTYCNKDYRTAFYQVFCKANGNDVTALAAGNP
ncbi:5-hydroxytryptamine receptor 1A-alpha-like [Glandiceps talaboti]